MISRAPGTVSCKVEVRAGRTQDRQKPKAAAKTHVKQYPGLGDGAGPARGLHFAPNAWSGTPSTFQPRACLTGVGAISKFALAAIVISSVTNLVDYNEAIHLWRVKKQDCLFWVAAFLGTLFLGVQIGLLLAIGLSLISPSSSRACAPR